MKNHRWLSHEDGSDSMCIRCGLTEKEARIIGQPEGCEEEPSRYLSELELFHRAHNLPKAFLNMKVPS